MDAALPYAERWQLIPGIALSAEQMAQLTNDIVWFVGQDAALADGTTPQNVLAPRVYVRATGEAVPASAQIAAQTIALALAGDLDNSGTIAGRSAVLDAENIRNDGERIGADESSSSEAREDLSSLGGTALCRPIRWSPTPVTI